VRAVTAVFLDEQRGLLTAAVRAVEARSSAELVVSIRRQSSAWIHVNAVAFAVTSFAALAYMLFSTRAFALGSILIDPLVLGLLVAAAIELSPDLKRWMTPRARLLRATISAAHLTFVARGVHRTLGRSGLLVYVSQLERLVILVADTEVERAWPEDLRYRTQMALTAALHRGAADFIAAVADLAVPLATALPRQEGDVNELADDVDAQLHRPWQGPS
jgi:putative membrane protein